MDANRDVTRILNDAAGSGAGRDAAKALFPIIYDELRAIAERRMSDERSAHTLQATALVNETYMKLVGTGREAPDWESRAHFFRAAATAMRRILVDHARTRDREKRGGGVKPISLEFAEVADLQDPTTVLALEEAMNALEQEDARAADIVQLRFYSGLSVPETARALGVSERTVMREWSFARARLFQLLGAGDREPGQ